MSLWREGLNAYIHFDTHGGDAEVYPRVGLGKAPSLPQAPHHRVPGPSRLRRCDRRAEA